MGGPLKHALIIIILVLLLSACAAPTQAPTATPVPPTATSLPTLSPVEALLDAYFAGEEIDVSGLSPAEFKEFSSQLADKLNAERGINPIIYNNEAYISPDNYMMMNYDGQPDMSETITMFHAIEGFDAAGNLQLNVNGEIITVPNSADIDWNMRVTDPHDPRIDWPTTKLMQSGLVFLQKLLSDQAINRSIMFPVVLADKNLGQVFISGEKQNAFVSSLSFLIIETDSSGHPILTRELLTIGGPDMRYYEEGASIEYGDGPIMRQTTPLLETIQVGNMYYMAVPIDQSRVYDKNLFASPQNYQGMIAGNEAFAIFNSETVNNQDVLLLTARALLARKP